MSDNAAHSNTFLPVTEPENMETPVSPAAEAGHVVEKEDVASDDHQLVFDAEAPDGGPDHPVTFESSVSVAPVTNGVAKNGREALDVPVSTSTPDTYDASPSPIDRTEEERDEQAEAMVIESLRAQVQDLFSQVTQLNTKLVRSYDRVSDLEDDLHMSSANARSSALKIAQLELERTQHLSALNTGLLVERSAVAAELTRVMERATDEAARAGKAESARAEIERELDDLSAGLFNQANNMVAQARFAQAGSERKVEEAETALRAAEDAVAAMQTQVQTLQREKEKAQAESEHMEMRMGKGKWIERASMAPSSKEVRLLSSHSPYQEFLLFVAHLRSIRPSHATPPAMSTLLPLPFLGRLQSEDSDPTVRLDLAPALNWLSRRSVVGAIHSGELTIEPISASALIEELSTPNYSSASIMAGSGAQGHNISCALCGSAIFPAPPATPGSPQPPLHPGISRSGTNTGTWSTSLFKNALAVTNTIVTTSMPSTQTPNQSFLYQERPHPTHVFIFRITAAQPTNTAQPSNKATYPLCSSGWCLARLRTTCSLWAFVRAALVERVWEEELLHAPVPKRAASRDSTIGSLVASVLPGGGEKQPEKATSGAKPPLPARKSKVGGFWGRASSAISASVAQVSQVSRSATTGSTPSSETSETSEKQLPSTPPRMLRTNSTPSTAASPTPQANGASPALPQRSKNRESRVATPLPPADHPSAAVNELGPPIVLHDDSSKASSPTIESPAFLTPNQDPVADPMQAFVVPDTSDLPAVLPTPGHVALPASPATPTVSNGVVPQATDVTATAVSQSVPAAPPAPDVKPTADPPSRTASPAPAHAPTLPTRSAARTASPAPGSPGGAPATPPPIPRRAAARAPRPVSLVAQAVTNAATTAAPDSPVSPTHHLAPTHPPHAEDAEKTAIPTVVEEESTPAPAEDLAKVETPTPAPVDSTEEGPKIDIPPPPTTENGVPSVVAPEPESTPAAQVSDSTAAPIAAVVAPAPEEESTPKPGVTAAPVIDANSEVTAATDTTVVAKFEDPTAIAEEANEVYVGEATWEERAWKELARLREDMFWARVGGVR